MYHLTKREKTLLILLGFIAVIGVYFIMILMPQLSAISVSNAEIAELDTQKTNIDSYLTRYGLHDARIKEVKEEINVEIENMLPMMEQEDLVDYVLDLVGDNISLTSITVSDYELTQLYSMSHSHNVTVNEATVQISFTCSKAEYLSFLDRIIEENKSIYLKDVSVASSNNGTTYSMNLLVIGFEGVE